MPASGFLTKQAPAGVRRWCAAVFAAAVLVGLDQFTKELAEGSLERGNPVPVIGTLVQFHLVYNPGAAFSLGTSSTWIFTIFSTIAVVALGWALSRRWPPALQAALVLLLAGAAGNLVDRYTRQPGFGVGHVVDFIALPNFPVFNVADICITAAGAMLVAASIWPTRFGLTDGESADD